MMLNACSERAFASSRQNIHAVASDAFKNSRRCDARAIVDLRVVSAMRLMERCVDRPMTTASLAEAVGLSRYYFIRLFQDQTGETVMEYIRRIRLERAAICLIDSSDSIVNIGLSVGYGSQSAFTRAFTQQFRLSPADYRRSSREAQRSMQQDLADDFRCAVISMDELGPVACLARRYLGVGSDPSSSWSARAPRAGGPMQADWQRIEIVYDDARITEPGRVRVDLCLPDGTRPDREPSEGGFQSLTLPRGTYAVMNLPHHGTMPDLGIYLVLGAWLERQKRYRRRGSCAMVKIWSAGGAALGDPPDRVLIPLDLIRN